MANNNHIDSKRAIGVIVSSKSIPLIFVSSKHQKADRVWAKMQGAKELVSKPYTAEQIMDQIKAYA